MPVSRAELPVKVAGPGFPLAEVALGGDVLRVRVPNGGDQERIVESELYRFVHFAYDAVVEVARAR